MKSNLLFALSFCFAAPQLFSQMGNALNFDGTDDGIDLNTPILSTTDGSQAYTLEAWIKTNSGDDDCIICQYYGGLVDGRFQFEIRDDKLNWWKGTTIFGTDTSIFSNTTITDGLWHHVAASRDASGIVTLFVDGNLEGTGSDPLPFYPINTHLGGRIASNSGYFGGDLDEVRIWDIVRSQADIQSTMWAELTGNESGLIAYYDFNQGVAGGNNAGETTLNDGTSNVNDGSLLNFDLIGNTSNWIGSTIPVTVQEIQKDQVTVHPNPTNGVLFLDDQNIRSVQVFNLLGELVFENSISGNQLDISDLQNGMYILSYSFEGITVHTRILKE